LGITLASLGLGWIGEPAFARLLEVPLTAIGIGENPQVVRTIAFVLAFGTISYLHIVVGELAPKSAALRVPEAISLWTAAPLYAFYWIMFPFIWVLNASANAILRRFGLEVVPGHGHEAPYSLDELKVIVRLSRPVPGVGSTPSTELRRMLAHALELPALCARDVMRPIHELVCIDSDARAATVRRLLQRYRYSRYGYVDNESGELAGVVHFKDIALEGPGRRYAARLHAHVRPIDGVDAQTPIGDLLKRFRLGRSHLETVRGEFGAIVGFMTLEDVLEAIFGDIRDEHEVDTYRQARREPLKLFDGSLLVRGDTPLYLLERALGVHIAESVRLSTVNGWLMEQVGHLPAEGDIVDVVGYRAEVLRVRQTAIESIRILTHRASD
jgi:CBS domain containing-hemolysin-like protein